MYYNECIGLVSVVSSFLVLSFFLTFLRERDHEMIRDSSSSSGDEEEVDPRSFGVKELVEQANIAMDSFHPDLAAKFYERALSLEPQNTEVMDDYAELLVGVGNVGKAVKLLRQSIALRPKGPASKYMSLAQLSEGRDALECYERGLKVRERGRRERM